MLQVRQVISLVTSHPFLPFCKHIIPILHFISIENIFWFYFFFTPHAQRERGKVIDRGVHIYICLWSKKIFESYFRDRLTFSNIDSRTSRRIYRLALLLRAPETLSSLSKSRISIFNAHLTLLVRKMTSHNSIGKYRHLVN